jgi:tetratricopeptide (TPR) repeat protein
MLVKNKRRFAVYLSVLGVVTTIGIVVASNTRSGSRDSDLNTLYENYASELADLSRDGADEQTRRQVYSYWNSVFLGKYHAMNPSDAPEGLRMTCLSIANGLGRWNDAELLAWDGIDNAKTWTDQLRSHAQLLSIHQAMAAESNDPADRDRVLTTATQIIETFRPKLGQPAFVRDRDLFTSMMHAFYTKAELLDNAGQHAEAAQIHVEAAGFAASIPADVMADRMTAWQPERCYERAAGSLLLDGRRDDAAVMLEQIGGLADAEHTPGFYAMILSGDLLNNEFDPDFTRLWLNGREWGPDEVRLAQKLAYWLIFVSPDALVNNQEAKEILKRILATDESVLIQADASASNEIVASIPTGSAMKAWEFEPITSNVLVELAFINQRLERYDEAADIAATVLDRYPEHPSIDAMAFMLE